MIDGQEPCLGRVERIWRARRGCGVHEARAAEHPDGILPSQRVQSGLGDRGAVDGHSLYRVAGRPVAYRFSSHLSGTCSLTGFPNRKYSSGNLPAVTLTATYEDFALDAQAVVRAISEELDRGA